jgi:transposase
VRFATSEQNLREALKSVPARRKLLVLEEGPMAAWAAGIARAHVQELIVSDPRRNRLVSEDPNKCDGKDTENLCRLLRLGELRAVYHAEDTGRAVFKAAVQHYHSLCAEQTALKLKIKAMYRQWGVVDVTGKSVYSRKGRQPYLEQVENETIGRQLLRLYRVLDEAEKMEAAALKEAKRLGRPYPEIPEFKKIPGIGDILALTFDAFVQTPHRFATKKKLWKYCRLGIRDRTSDGKPLGYKALDPAGVSVLKAMSFRAFTGAMRGGDNEVKAYYHRSLQETGNPTHARLNTQRKILAMMYGLWKRGEPYRPELCLGPCN